MVALLPNPLLLICLILLPTVLPFTPSSFHRPSHHHVQSPPLCPPLFAEMMGEGRTYDYSSLAHKDDTESGWYIAQCMATTELSVAAQLLVVVPKTPGAMDDIDKILVPTRLAGDSRGTKTFTTEKAIYPSYIFLKMKLTESSYKGILSCSRVASFVGERIGINGTDRSMVYPVRLGEKEVARFEGLAAEGNITTKRDNMAFGFEIGEMVSPPPL